MSLKDPQKLSDVSLLIEDCLHATAPTVDEGYPLIRTPNIGRGRLNLENVHRVTQDTYDKWTKRAVPIDDDLILAREATAGNVSIVKNGERVCLGQRTVLIRPDKSKIDCDFLCYYLLAPRQQSALLAGATGATAPHVNMRDIRKLPLRDLPEREVQRKLGSILAAYDDLIENNLRRIKLLEESARQLHKEWFVRLRFPGYEHVKIRDGVPEGWEKIKFGDLCNEIRETVLPKDVDPETPYIGLEHMPRRSITLLAWGVAANVTSSKRRFKAGDILFGKIRPYFHKVGIALVDGVASSDAIIIRPQSETLKSIVLLVSSSDRFVADASQRMKEGSKMPRADWKLMQSYSVAFPPIRILSLLNEQINPILKQLRVLAAQNSASKEARDILLPKLMNGEIEA